MFHLLTNKGNKVWVVSVEVCMKATITNQSTELKKVEKNTSKKAHIKEPKTFEISCGSDHTPYKILIEDKPLFDKLLLPVSKGEYLEYFPFSVYANKTVWDFVLGKFVDYNPKIHDVGVRRDNDKYMYWGEGKGTLKIERKKFKSLIEKLKVKYQKKGMILRGNKFMWGDYKTECESIWNQRYLNKMKKAA